MEIVKCPNGHFYDPNITKTCPKCAQADNLSYAKGIDLTMPPADLPITTPISAGNIGSQITFPVIPSVETEVDNYPKTEPVSASSIPAPVSNPFFDVVNHFFDHAETPSDPAPGPAPKMQEYTPTVPMGFDNKTVVTTPATTPEAKAAPAVNYASKPVVGWIVCIDGPNKGCDYRVFNGYNYIGRAQNMDICISADMYISNENAAIIGYDEIEKLFYFGPGMGHNTVRVNEKMCLGQTLLNAYDRIKLGKTTLIFIPLCGERFDWKNEK